MFYDKLRLSYGSFMMHHWYFLETIGFAALAGGHIAAPARYDAYVRFGAFVHLGLVVARGFFIATCQPYIMKLRNIVAMTLVIYQVCVCALREFVTTLPVLRVLAIMCILFIVHLVSSFNTKGTYPFIFDKFIGLTLYFASDHQIVNTCILLALLFGVDHLILEPGLMGWNWVFNVYYVCVTWIFIVKEPRDKLKVCGVQACVVVSAGSIILTYVLLSSLFTVCWRCSFDSLLLVVCLSNPKP